jgi:hypothetical protein
LDQHAINFVLEGASEKNGKIVTCYRITPRANTIFILDGRTAVCGAPGSGKTVIDPMVRSPLAERSFFGHRPNESYRNDLDNSS